jgi:hypothetical protein
MLLATGSVQLADAETPATEATVTVPLAPTRILDTRSGIGAPVGPLGPSGSLDLQVTGAAGVPVGAVGVLLNVTADGATEQTYLTIWPAGQARPEASSLNPAPGQPVPNFIEAKLGADGKLSIFNFTGSVHVIADVAGYQVPVSSVSGLPGGTGAQGPAGPRGVSAWEPVPPGVTITGTALWRRPMSNGQISWETVTMGARPAVPLVLETIGFQNSPVVAPADVDPDCTGSADTPTAPPGQLCAYVIVSSGVTTVSAIPPPDDYGNFSVSFTANGASQVYLQVAWAYTAPL